MRKHLRLHVPILSGAFDAMTPLHSPHTFGEQYRLWYRCSPTCFPCTAKQHPSGRCVMSVVELWQAKCSIGPQRGSSRSVREEACDTSGFIAWRMCRGSDRTNRRTRRKAKHQWGLALAALTSNGRLHLQSPFALPATPSKRAHHTRPKTPSIPSIIAYFSTVPLPARTSAASSSPHWIDRPADSASTLPGPRDKGQG
jgi:hypothetical protein